MVPCADDCVHFGYCCRWYRGDSSFKVILEECDVCGELYPPVACHWICPACGGKQDVLEVGGLTSDDQ